MINSYHLYGIKEQTKYGGSPENNTRFAKDIYHAIREVVGKDVPILFRISLDHRFMVVEI